MKLVSLASLSLIAMAALAQTPAAAPKPAPAAAPKPAAAKPAAAASSVDSVIQSVKAGLSESIIIRTIQRENKPANLSTADLVKLKNAGVSEKIIEVNRTTNTNRSIRFTSTDHIILHAIFKLL